MPNQLRLVANFIFSLLAFIASSSALAQVGPQSINLQGRIVKPDGTAVESANVDFMIQIRSPLPSNCILYEESHTLDMTNSGGTFNINVGAGARSGAAFHNTSTLKQTFDNSASLISSLNCATGTTYDPAALDTRKLRLSFDDGSGVQTLSQDQTINAVPYALYADSVQGKSASDLVQVVPALESTPGTSQSRVNRLIDTDWAGLDALLNGTSTLYAKAAPTAAVNNNNQRLINVADPTAAQDAATKNYTDTTIGGYTATVGVLAAGDAGKAITWDGTKWVASAVSTTDATKLPLAGGTMSGAIDMGGNNITSAGHVQLGTQRTLLLGRYDSTQETTLVGGLTAADKGRTWFNTTSDKIRVWDGNSAEDVAGLDSTKVAKSGDTMTGTLNLPANGLVAGTNQLVLSSGNVGVGTAAPGVALDVVGEIRTSSNVQIPAGSRLILKHGDPNHSIQSQSNNMYFNMWQGNFNFVNSQTSTTVMAMNGGNVGIGVGLPARLLHVNGPMRLNAAALPGTPATGDIAIDSGDSNSFKYYNGSAWVKPGASSLTVGQTAGTAMGADAVPNCTASQKLQMSLGPTFGWTCVTDSTDDTTKVAKAGDTMTGTLNLPANGLVAGTNQFVLSGGNVGIGTASPAAVLDVNGTAIIRGRTDFFNGVTQRGYVDAASGNINWFGGIYSGAFQSGNGTAAFPGFAFTADSNTGFFSPSNDANVVGISTNGSERMRIDSTGLVGIGTSSPARQLHVAGPMRLTPAALPGTPAAGDVAIDSADGNSLKYYNGSAWIKSEASSGGDFKADGTVPMTGNLRLGNNFFNNDGDANEGLNFDTAGRGTFTSTSAAGVGLTVKNLTATTGSSAHLSFMNGSVVGSSLVSEVTGANSQNDSLIISTRRANTLTEAMRISSTGAVGIGTAAPNYPLHVSGNAYFGSAALTNIPAAPVSLVSNSPNTLKTHLSLVNTGGGAGSGSAIDFYTYDVATYANPGLRIAAADNNYSGELVVYTKTPGGADDLMHERMRLTNSGNLGIGTTSPARLLHVEGPMRLTPAALPGSPAAGDLAIDSAASNALKWYNGSAWQTVGTGGGSGDFLANGTVPMTATLRSYDGNATTPGLSFAGDSDTGFYSVAGGTVGFVQNGVERIRFSSTIQSLTTSAFHLSNGISAAFPSYAFSNDTDNGMYRVTTDSIGFSTAGTHRMSIEADGDIVVNKTSAANGKFDVAGSIVMSGGTSGYAGFQPAAAAGSTIYTLPAAPINGNVLSTDASGVLSWIAPGGISIGQTAGTAIGADAVPNCTSVQKLQMSLGPTFSWSCVSESTAVSQWTTSGSNIYYNTGSVGIGTTTPTQALHVVGNTFGTGIFWSAGGTAAIPGLNAGQIGNGLFAPAANALGIATGTTERVRIDSSGNVGIGTTTPTVPLEVSGTVKANIFSTAQVNGSAGTVQVGVGDTNTGFFRPTGNNLGVATSGIERMRIDGSGNVGIGTTSPGYLLDIQNQNTTGSSLRINRSGTSYNASMSFSNAGAFTPTNPGWNFGLANSQSGWSVTSYDGTTATQRLYIDPTGNVGIGTTTPNSPLEVIVPDTSWPSTYGGFRVGDTGSGGSFIFTDGTTSSNQFAPTLEVKPVGGTRPFTIATKISGANDTGTTPLLVFDYMAASTAVATRPLLDIRNNGTSRAIMDASGNLAIGTTTQSGKLTVAGVIVSPPTTLASGATINLSTSNTHVLASVGGSTITLSNMVHGGKYTLLITDTTSRTYTFSGCNTSKFKPANAATTDTTPSVYNILTIYNGATYDCYIDWSTGYL